MRRSGVRMIAGMCHECWSMLHPPHRAHLVLLNALERVLQAPRMVFNMLNAIWNGLRPLAWPCTGIHCMRTIWSAELS